MRERRQHVRVRPAPDHHVRVVLLREPEPVELQVVDLSVGGVGFLCGEELEPIPEVGADLKLTVELPRVDLFEAKGVVRHFGKGLSAGLGGLELLDVSEDQTRALRRYVGELLQRGMSV